MFGDNKYILIKVEVKIFINQIKEMSGRERKFNNNKRK